MIPETPTIQYISKQNQVRLNARMNDVLQCLVFSRNFLEKKSMSPNLYAEVGKGTQGPEGLRGISFEFFVVFTSSSKIFETKGGQLGVFSGTVLFSSKIILEKFFKVFHQKFVVF